MDGRLKILLFGVIFFLLLFVSNLILKFFPARSNNTMVMMAFVLFLGFLINKKKFGKKRINE
jgi:hypothetical protein